jgi:hypothetical protein
VTGTVLLFGGLEELDESQRLILQRSPQLRVEAARRPWEAVERAIEGAMDAVVILKGPIAEHDSRMELISSLGRHGFAGRILACGSFLTEKQDALAAGAHYAFDPAEQRIEEVVRQAVERPVLAADHVYLRALFHGEWAHVSAFDEALPAAAPDVLVTAVSRHPEEAYWERLVAYARGAGAMRCILVEDVEDENLASEALATGLQPYVVLHEEGLQKVLTLGRGFLRGAWLARVAGA